MVRAVLFFDPAGGRLLVRRQGGWQPAAPQQTVQDVLVVTDLHEETVTHEAFPALRLSDRKALAMRRLASAWSDAVLRGWTWLGNPIYGAGHMVFFALPGADATVAQLRERLAGGLRIVGVRATSQLLWERARRLYPRGVCLVLVALPSAIRLVALANRLPILTRRLEVVDEAALTAEIQATWRYLINSRLAPIGSTPVVHWPAGRDAASGLAWLLEARSSVELAPRDLRAAWLTRQLSLAAWGIGGLALVAALGLAYADLLRLERAWTQHAQVQADERAARRDIVDLESRITALGVPVRAWRGLNAFVQAELEHQPEPQAQLAHLSQVLLAVYPQVRVQKLEWRRTQGQGCDEGRGAGAVLEEATHAAASANAPAPPGALLDLKVWVDPAQRPHARHAALTQLSERLAALPGSTLVIDEGRLAVKAALKSAQSTAVENEVVRFCLTVHGQMATPADGRRR